MQKNSQGRNLPKKKSKDNPAVHRKRPETKKKPVQRDAKKKKQQPHKKGCLTAETRVEKRLGWSKTGLTHTGGTIKGDPSLLGAARSSCTWGGSGGRRGKKVQKKGGRNQRSKRTTVHIITVYKFIS